MARVLRPVVDHSLLDVPMTTPKAGRKRETAARGLTLTISNVSVEQAAKVILMLTKLCSVTSAVSLSARKGAR